YISCEAMILEEWLQPDAATVTANQPLCRILVRENSLVECDLILESPESGKLHHSARIGELVQAKQAVATIS
ncbi:hypothetical protein ACMWQW_27010, partial [Escherichia coli]